MKFFCFCFDCYVADSNATERDHSGAAGLSPAAVVPSSSKKERARQELQTAWKNGVQCIPTAAWRSKYSKVRGIGTVAAMTLGTLLSRNVEEVSQPDTQQSSRSQSVCGVLQGPKQEVVPFRQRLFSAKASHHAIHTLDLGNLKISDNDFAKLLPSLMADSLIRRAYFSGNGITDSGIDDLIEQIKDGECRSSIEVLSLAQNAITTRGLVEFLLFSTNLMFLRRLEVSAIPSSDEEDAAYWAERVAVMGECLSCSKMEQFYFRGSGVSSPVIRAVLCEVLRQCKLLRHFACVGLTLTPSRKISSKMSKDDIASLNPVKEEAVKVSLVEHPVKVLSQSLVSSNNVLSSIVLHAPLDAEAVSALAVGIEKSKSLTKLVLSHCDLRCKSFHIIGSAVGKSQSIRYLDLSYPHSSVSDARADLALPVKHAPNDDNNASLSVPDEDADGCFITDGPLKTLIQSLRTSKTLAELFLVGVWISVSDMEELCDCMEVYHNASLVHITTSFKSSDALTLKLSNLILRNRMQMEHPTNHMTSGCECEYSAKPEKYRG